MKTERIDPQEQSAARQEPAFLDDDGPSLEIPPFISTANAYSMFGLKDGESVQEAMTRHKSEDEVAKAERRWATKQALASSRIEGHIPSPEFLADCDALDEGTMTTDEVGARSLERALAADKAAALKPKKT